MAEHLTITKCLRGLVSLDSLARRFGLILRLRRPKAGRKGGARAISPVILVQPAKWMNQHVEEKRVQIAAICRQHHVRRLALFGSALRDDFDASSSDLDFVVEFEPLATGTYANMYFGLIDALERLFGRRVDPGGSRFRSQPVLSARN